MPMKMSTRRTNWASEMPASIGGSFFMACTSRGRSRFARLQVSNRPRGSRGRGQSAIGAASPLSNLGPKQSTTPGQGPLVPRLAEARHRALTGFEPTVLCAASALAPVAEPVDAPNSKSGVRKDVPVRVGPGAPRRQWHSGIGPRDRPPTGKAVTAYRASATSRHRSCARAGRPSPSATRQPRRGPRRRWSRPRRHARRGRTLWHFR